MSSPAQKANRKQCLACLKVNTDLSIRKPKRMKKQHDLSKGNIEVFKVEEERFTDTLSFYISKNSA